ncbi:glycoside hydrolase family 28 protein [Microbacterium sp. ZW T2_14]|uniref:glycoside hydrolase family 28 protein n=1 Tax=Microbacterium sp. ZW T2_14 TaxID=3378079 RepID=UPI003853449B
MKFRTIRTGALALCTVAALALGTLGAAGVASAATLAQKDEPQATSPVNVDRAPTGAVVLDQSIIQDSTSDGLGLTLVWGKPAGYEQFVDYAVYRAGKKRQDAAYGAFSRVGLASSTATPAQHAFDVFRADPSNAAAQPTTTHNLLISGLERGRDYRFRVAGVLADGTEVALPDAYTTGTVAMPNERPEKFQVANDGYAGILPVASAADGGAFVSTTALQQAIDDASAFAVANPGRQAEVVIPRNARVISAAVFLKTGVTLRVDGTLTASLDLAGYVPEGTQFTMVNAEKFLNLINVEGTSQARLQNVRIIGTGTIDGQGWKHRTDGAPNVAYGDQLGLAESLPSTFRTIAENGLLAGEMYRQCVAAGGPTGDSNCYKKRSNLIEGEHIDNMYIGGGLRLQNPANSVTGFKYLSNYIVNGITVQSFNGNNGDSINVARFKGFTALNNVINSGDDNIVLNAGNISEYQKDPIGAVAGSAWIFDNYLARGHGAIAFGSGTTSWIDNVLVEDNIAVGTSDGIRAKSKPGSGGGVRFVTVRDMAMKDLTNLVDGQVDPLTIGYQMDGAPFIFTTHYPGDYTKTRWPSFHDWDISRVTVDGSRTGGIVVDGIHDDAKLAAAGIPFIASNRLHFRDVHFTNTGIPLIDELTDSSFENVTFDGVSGDAVWADSKGLKNVTVDGAAAPEGDRDFAVTAGGDTVLTTDQQELRLVTDASFRRFYVNTLPEDVLARVGEIAVDGVAVDASLYPAFGPKSSNLPLVAGTDAAISIAPVQHTNIGTAITLRAPFLASLAPGCHDIELRFQNGVARTSVQVPQVVAATTETVPNG